MNLSYTYFWDINDIKHQSEFQSGFRILAFNQPWPFALKCTMSSVLYYWYLKYKPRTTWLGCFFFFLLFFGGGGGSCLVEMALSKIWLCHSEPKQSSGTCRYYGCTQENYLVHPTQRWVQQVFISFWEALKNLEYGFSVISEICREKKEPRIYILKVVGGVVLKIKGLLNQSTSRTESQHALVPTP